MTRRPHEHTAWNNLPQDFQKLALTNLTERQLTTYRLRQGGMQLRQIALHMDISISTVRSLLERADQRINQALRKAAT